MVHSTRTGGVVARRLIAAAIIGAFAFVPAAHAGSIILGNSGWEALWDSSLDGFVEITVDAVTANAVFIEKSAEFRNGPNSEGLFDAIPIVFRQIAFPAVSRIIINDEIITNSTGVDWTAFNMEVIDHGDAFFNPALTNASGGGLGFSTNPFNNQSFEGGNTVFAVNGFGLGPNGSDAIVPNGGVWFPGLTGELVIDANPHESAPFTLFTLKERPIPEPGTALLLIAGLAFGIRRR